MLTTIPYAFEQTLANYPDKVAIQEFDVVVTFRELYQRAVETAAVLKWHGIKKGDRVGVYMNKSLEQVYALLGIIYSDAIIVPILPRLKEDNISNIVEHSGVKLIIADAVVLASVERYAETVAIVVGNGVSENYSSLADLRKDFSGRYDSPFSCIGIDSAAIIFSSGSTGRPKGILISHRNLFDGAVIVSNYLNTTVDDRISGVLQLNFDYGLNQLWQTLYRGCTLVLHEFRFPNDFFSHLLNDSITVLPVMPVIITKMFDKRLYRANELQRITTLKYICSTGGRLSGAMIDALGDKFPEVKIYSMFGLTEAFRSTYLAPEMLKLKPTSIGKAIPEVEVMVLDDLGDECPAGQVGELVHRGGCMTKGYWNAPEETDLKFRSHPKFPGERLLFSGDLVKKDEEGYLYFVGRRDSMIKTNGYRVSPTEVEEEAIKHHEVESAVVFGLENLSIGEDVVLIYSTFNGNQIAEEEYRLLLKELLPNYMMPNVIKHIQQMPVTGNGGKIDRTRVIEQYCNDKAKPG